MMQTDAIQYHRISFESLAPFWRGASQMIATAALECIAMVGVLLAAVVITLMLGL